jgi:hypothetical protein
MVVSCHDNRRSRLIDLVKQRHDSFTRCRVKVSSWLVCEKYEWTINECSRDRHALLLST